MSGSTDRRGGITSERSSSRHHEYREKGHEQLLLDWAEQRVNTFHNQPSNHTLRSCFN